MLPEDKLVCRVGFLLVPDDLDIHVEYPTQIISTLTDDGSDLAKLVQYLAARAVTVMNSVRCHGQ